MIPEQHHGGRTGKSTLTAKTLVDYEITKHKDNKENTILLTTDPSSALDVCDHTLLLSKLEHVGIRNKPYELI